MEIGNRYQLLDELGKGGMGTVYRGLDSDSNQAVAIKELNSLLTTPELIERFKREGEALRELNHPNIVKLLDTVEHNGAYYLVMEYVSGGDLHALLKTGQLPIERCLKLALDLADALTRAHKLDIIHRDLKPANVLLAEDGTLRLSDFGVARMGQRERVTGTDMIVGTVDYLAPEALDGADIDPRADIWAFGVMLFEMVGGKRPFTGESLTATLTAILTHPVPDLEALRPDAPIALIDLVYRMLEKEREARIRSVRQVGLELEDILQGRTTQTPPETRFAPPTPDFLQRPKHNLPAQTTPFVGREAELTELAKLLDNPKIRLITIVAQGGMGKTRLALEVAGQIIVDVQAKHALPLQNAFSNGVYFVELAPLSDAANIVSAIAEAVSYQFQADGRDQKQQVLDFLHNKKLLLVLDNYEHLLEGVTLVTEILKVAPNVKVLATSRQRLNQSGETLFNLEGMDFPAWGTPEDALEYAAVKLFMQSAKRAKPDFEITTDNMDAIARICRLVRGLPLGIVLAASWLSMLSADEIATEIAKGIDFLESDMSDIPERQRSIRAVFDYSWDLMTDDEKQVFMKLSVFRGGFTREAAEAVAGATLRILMNLMNKSLIRRDSDNGRYDIHELLRQYAADHLGQTNVSRQLNSVTISIDAHNRHSRYYMTFLAQKSEETKRGEQPQIFEEIHFEIDNIREAWQWAIDHKYEVEIAQAAHALWMFYERRNRNQEGEQLFRTALESFSMNISIKDKSYEVGKIQTYYGIFCHSLNMINKSRQIFKECLIILRRYDARPEIALVLARLGDIALWVEGDAQAAQSYFQESLSMFREIGNQWGIVYDLLRLGYSSFYLGEYELAKQQAEEGIVIHEARQESSGKALMLQLLALSLLELEEYESAKSFIKEALQLSQKTNLQWSISIIMYTSAAIACAMQDFGTARRYLYTGLKDYPVQFRGGVLYGILVAAILFIAVDNKIQALELLSFLLASPSAPFTGRLTLNHLIDTLHNELPSDIFSTAFKRGETLEFETVVQELLVEFAEDA